MNRTLVFVSALGAGLLTTAVSTQAQTTPAPAAPAPAAAAPAAAPAPVQPQAIPAKIALIAFEQSVFATNEGQKAVQDVQKKYEPKKNQIDALAAEVDSLKKQLQSAPATLSDEEKATRIKNIDTKEKQLNRDAEDATAAYNADLQEAYGKLAVKVNATMRKYAADNGYTLVLDVSGGQQNASPVLWAVQQTDVTEAVINAYNVSSGVAAPPPSAPSANRPRSTAPAKPAASKPAAPPK